MTVRDYSASHCIFEATVFVDSVELALHESVLESSVCSPFCRPPACLTRSGREQRFWRFEYPPRWRTIRLQSCLSAASRTPGEAASRSSLGIKRNKRSTFNEKSANEPLLDVVALGSAFDSSLRLWHLYLGVTVEKAPFHAIGQIQDQQPTSCRHH